MRHLAFRLVVLALLAVFAAAWTKEDHEIFRLRDEVARTEGHNVTFYEFIGVKPTASQSDLTKAFRKKAKLIHPDKAKRNFIASRAKPPKGRKGRKPGVHVSKPPSEREIQAYLKEATERYARLSVVAEILKGPGRERYDHFLKNGFPRWRGTGYYYSRFRPGLGTVLVGLFIAFGGAAHYGALILSWKRQREFVERYIRHARRAAWGDDLGIKGLSQLSNFGAGDASASASGSAPSAAQQSEEAPQAINRRQKRMMERENRKEKKSKAQRGAAGGAEEESGTSTPIGTVSWAPGDRKRVVAENGKVLIVDSIGNVFLEEETEDGEKEEFLLDVNEIPRPTIRDTMVYRLPIWLFHKTIGRFTGGFKPETEVEEVAMEETDSDESIPTPQSSASEGKRKTRRR